MKEKPLTKTLNKKEVLQNWLSRVEQIENLLQYCPQEHMVFDVVYLIFPLIDSISFNLFRNDMHTYLQDIGISPVEVAIVYDAYRNGFMHNSQVYDLIYQDGFQVNWMITSGRGTGRLPTFYPGFKDKDFPENSEPADKPVEYEFANPNSINMVLHIDTLLALLRYDLENRLSDTKDNEVIEFIVGMSMLRRRPKFK